MVTNKVKHYPTKTTINLVMREENSYRLPRMIWIAAVMLLLIGCFCKFAVIDRIRAANQAEAAAATAQAQLVELQQANSDYESVRIEYARYFSTDLISQNKLAADCMDILGLINDYLLSSSGIQSVSVSTDTIGVNLTGITLNQASSILQALYTSPLVDSVNLYTANTLDDNNDNALISMTITLKQREGAI